MSALSEQYAVALFELAQKEDMTLQIEESLNVFMESLDNEAYAFFSHPGIKADKKKAVVETLKMPNLLQDFLFLILDKNRFDQLAKILESYKSIRSNADKEMHVVAYSKTPLTQERIEQLKEAYERKYDRTVILENRTDDSIVGGLRFEFDGKVIDDTINNTLKQFKSRLTK